MLLFIIGVASFVSLILKCCLFIYLHSQVSEYFFSHYYCLMKDNYTYFLDLNFCWDRDFQNAFFETGIDPEKLDGITVIETGIITFN